MTNSQKLGLRSSEIGQRLNEISGLEGEALTDEVRTESDALALEYRDVATKWRAAIVAESAEDAKVVPVEDLDPETRERLELRGKARVSDFVTAALTGRPVLGASAEYADAEGLSGLMPLDLLDASGVSRGRETGRDAWPGR